MSEPEPRKVPPPTLAMKKKAADCDASDLIARLDYRISLAGWTDTGKSGWYDESFNKTDLRHLRDRLNDMSL
jgi:hypothetical protein